MMSKKRPQLRFEGFTDDWEQRKLGDVISISSEKNGNQFSRADVLSVSREAGVVNQIEYQGRSFAGASIANYRVVHKGDLIYTKSPLKGAPNGIFKTSEAEGIVSPLYAVYQSREANAAFVGWLLSNDNFATHYLYPLVNKGSKNTLLVSDADAISGHLSFPNIDEQAKIVSFFTQLDNLIALHQRKLDLLKEQKKGYLQKMFPKNGEKVPELRFAGFADDWEERKFENNIVSIQTGTNLLGTDTNEGTPLLKMGNIQRGYFSFNKLEYLDSNSNVESENIVNYGDFLFNTRNTLELVGKGATWTGMSGKYAFNSNIARFKFNGIDTIFFNYLYNTQQVISQVHARAVGTTSVAAVYPRDLNSLLYYLPSIEEQKKIGSFFNQLDNTIALHQRKLDLLKEQKKGFLQKMFV
ncbi:restriction endonuclease subunit S [Lactococcus taiwanensis]|uniref:restriction endonuclease subunit S n=1 Tax=Lactococcus taiwanensis TaxID=1151742 RepID=UPI0028A5D3EF|nr:restriction endonuclease subunit S [Lactococcus taiwanensis]